MPLAQHLLPRLCCLAVGLLWLAPSAAGAVPGAVLSQDGSSVSMRYTGGCEPGGPCADFPAGLAGPEIAVTAGRDAAVTFEDPPGSIIARVEDRSGYGGRALGVTPTADPATWLVGLDTAVRDGQTLSLDWRPPSDGPGGRHYIATLRVPAQAPAPPPKERVGLSVISARLEGGRLSVSLRPTVAGDLAVTAFSAAGRRLSSKRVRASATQRHVILQLSPGAARRVARVSVTLTADGERTRRSAVVQGRAPSRR